MVNALHTNKSREHIIATQQTSDKTPLSLRSELNNELFHLTAQVQVARFKQQRKEVRLLEAKKADIAEQLRILKAFDPRIVRLMERVAIRRFREETRGMQKPAAQTAKEAES